MARFGTNFDDVKGEFGGSAPLPEPGVQDFEITKVTDGVQTKGNDANSPYFSARCTQMSGEAPGTRSTSQFLGMGTTPWKNGSCQKAQTKGFLEAIGRDDLLHAGGDSTELVGTTFRAQVFHDTDNKGQTRANLRNVEPLSHANTAPANAAPAQAPVQPQAQAPASAAGPAPNIAGNAPVQAQAPTAPPQAAPKTTRRRSR